MSHPKIGDAAVTSIPDERQGEAPKAFIVRKDEGLTEKEVMKFMASKVREREREREEGARNVQWQHCIVRSIDCTDTRLYETMVLYHTNLMYVYALQ